MPDPSEVTDDVIEKFEDYFYKYFDSDKLTAYIGDVLAVWYVICICAGISFVLAFVYLILLRCCASVVVFFTLVSVFFLLGGFGTWLFLERDRFEVDTTYYKAMLYGAYTLWGLCALYVIILLCICNRIRLGVAVIKATA